MDSKNIQPLVFRITGIIMSIIGVLFIGVYILEAYTSRIGEPDQSLLFWYLPFLFVGFIVLVSGIITSIHGYSDIRRIKSGRLFSLVITLLLMILLTILISIIVTILLVPFWSWLEASTGIESLGHSGPDEWCYAVVFFLLAFGSAIILMVYRQKRKIQS